MDTGYQGRSRVDGRGSEDDRKRYELEWEKSGSRIVARDMEKVTSQKRIRR